MLKLHSPGLMKPLVSDALVNQFSNHTEVLCVERAHQFGVNSSMFEPPITHSK
jgi:hypothetical protein